MLPGLAEPELAEQLGERCSLGLVDGEFDEAHAAAAAPLAPALAARPRGGKLVLQQQQRAHAVDRGPRRRAGAKLVVEDFQRQRAGVTGRGHRLHEFAHRQIALSGKAAEMPAPREDVQFELRRVGQLHQEDLVGRDRADRTGRQLRRQGVEASRMRPIDL